MTERADGTSASASGSDTASATASETETDTDTASETETDTDTASGSETETASGSDSDSDSDSVSASATVSGSDSDSASASDSASETDSDTASGSETETASGSDSDSVSDSVSASDSGSASDSVSASDSGSDSDSDSGSASDSASGSASDSATDSVSGSASASGSAPATVSVSAPATSSVPGVSTAPAAPWLFSARIDLAVFLGSALGSLALLVLAPWLGAGAAARDGATTSPAWSWIAAVVLVDVAHVWSTAFVVYLDPAELRRRPALYAGAPLAAWLVGVGVYVAGGPDLFWRVVAYLAAFHFVRQQYGWVMMYRARAGERDRLGRWIDGAMIYATTVVPLILWHTELPRAFWWMREGDFAAGLPRLIGRVALALYGAIAVAYLARALAAARTAPPLWGKHVVVATSAVCWYVGIVATNSDYAFTVTNVFIHGVPYAALVFLYARRAATHPESAHGLAGRVVRRGLWPFLATLWAVAYLEELLWDRTIWHDHPALFGAGPDLSQLAFVLVPLLAVPQLTHYALDGFLWRRASNPRLGELLGRRQVH